MLDCATEKVIIGDATLYHGDCMDVLPTLGKVDAVVTDPPYGIGLNTDNSRFSGGTKANIAKRGTGIGPAGGSPIIGDGKELNPSFMLKYGDEQIIWGWHCFPNKLPKGACLIWVKRLDPAFGSFLSDAEIAWYSKGHGVYCFRDTSMHSEAKIRAHPTQKPVPLFTWCIKKIKGDIVLDPFMGSGTTGVACMNLGRKFIGIEIERKYFDIACERIAGAQLQDSLFPPDRAGDSYDQVRIDYGE